MCIYIFTTIRLRYVSLHIYKHTIVIYVLYHCHIRIVHFYSSFIRIHMFVCVCLRACDMQPAACRPANLQVLCYVSIASFIRIRMFACV